MDTHFPYLKMVRADDIVKVHKEPVSRRALLKLGLLGTTATALASIDALAWVPQRIMHAATAFSDIQFDIGNFISPVQTNGNVRVQFGPIFTFMQPARLTRTPSKIDQQMLADAFTAIEASYAFSPSGIFVYAAYGLPYFRRLPTSIVTSYMPLCNDGSKRPVLEEAVPSPTDVSTQNPGIMKQTFNVPVQIESNDMLFTMRSDIMSHITDVMAWLQGSNSLNGKSVTSPSFNGLFSFGASRMNFVQQGLPYQLAVLHNFPFANMINPAASIWSGFADQQGDGSTPSGAAVTFAGSSASVLTTAKVGDYFDNGSIQHLSHAINDLAYFYGTRPYADDIFSNFDPAIIDHKKYRVGHEQALQRSVRAADGTLLHIRNDGPGLSTLDIPGGSLQPTLEFTAFVPTAEFFRVMRINAASLDYVKVGQQGGTAASVPPGVEAADSDHDGLEQFLTTTRRQNFLVPPRRHRAFPLLELTSRSFLCE